MNRTLVTGSSGRVGRAAVAALSASWEVIGFDRAPPAADPPHRFVRGHVADLAALHAAMAGVNCVIHLAAAPDDDPGPKQLGTFPDDADNFVSDLVPANVVGTYHVLKAAVRAGVKRVILASSGQVIDGHLPKDQPRDEIARVVAGGPLVTGDSPTMPRYLYASTKVFLEAVGRVFAKTHALEVLCARLGWCPRPGQEAEIAGYPLAPWVYLSGDDVGRFLVAAAGSPWPTVTDPDGRAFTYGIVYATSKPPDGRELYDLSVARRLGYEPQDEWNRWLAGRG